MRLRIHFYKTEAMRYTGHLDLHRAWERMVRRAGLPLAYSQGFRPHPRINLGSALPLGFTSEDEVVDIWLESAPPLEDIKTALERRAPPGIQIKAVEEVDAQLRALQADLLAAEYQITLLEPLLNIDQRIHTLSQEEILPRRWRDKDYDLRPLILELDRLPDDPTGNQRVHVVLSAREGATGRPEEVIAALGGQPEMSRIHRTHLIFRLQEPSHAQIG